MKKIVGFICITSILVFGAFYLKKYPLKDDVVEVNTIQCEITDLYDYITLRGKVSEKIRYNIFSEVAGIVREVYVSVGDNIVNGQELMRIVPIDDTVINNFSYDKMSTIVSSIIDSFLNGGTTAEAKEVLSYYVNQEDGSVVILSPCSGTVMSLNCDVNDKVDPEYPCLVISDLTKLEIRAQIEEQHLSRIDKDMKCTAVVNALSNKTVNCSIREINPFGMTALSINGSNEVMTDIILSVDDEVNFLKPGYTARVNIINHKKENAILIPYEAIGQDAENKQYVLTLSNGKLDKKVIKTGMELDSSTEVLEGLKGNEVLVTNPDRIKAGDTVVIK